MSTHVKYIERVANTNGEYPIDTRTIELGGHDASFMLIELTQNPEGDSPEDLLVTIDAAHHPQDFADFLATVLHGMAGSIEGITSEHKRLVKAEATQAAPADKEVLEGEIVELGGAE